jgi:ABC-type Fe3+-siderophore transport system permease subunit
MGAEVLASPLTVLVSLLVALASATAYYSGRQSPLVAKQDLTRGYLAVVLACILLSAISAYVSPEEASNKWQVPPERYWPVLLNAYLTTLILMGSVAVVGLAIVGFPIVVALGKFGRATTPHVLLASVFVSAALVLLLSIGDSTPFLRLGSQLASLTGLHLILAFCFCLGARLPWRRTPSE